MRTGANSLEMATLDTGSRQRAIEVYHHFTTDAEYDGMRALLEGYDSRHPDATVNEEGDDNLSLNVKNRILQEDPPDVWDVWPGKTLVPYDESRALLDLDDLWADHDLDRHYTEGAARAARIDDRYLAVPMDVYRINNLFYNVELAESAGVDPGSVDDPREFLEVLGNLRDELDVPGFPLHMKDPFGVLQFWETLLLAEYGQSVYRDVVDGRAGSHRDAVRGSLELLEAYAEFATDDAFFLATIDTDQQFVAGEAAFKHDGDWAAGGFLGADDFDYRTDWDHVPFPGTAGLYQMNMNAFVASSQTASPESVEQFLAYAGSAEGLRRFNEAKGSLPPRTDVTMDSFSRFHQSQYDDFNRSSAQPPSITHGLAVSPDALIELKSSVASYVTTWDLDATSRRFVEALSTQ